MKEIESIASALFDKIRTRFDSVNLGDESAKATQDPEKARFFNFTYSNEDGDEFGKITLSLIDETGLKVYYSQNITSDMDREQRKEWYKFLRGMRKFAKRNLLTFDTRDINKSNLNLQDIKQQAKTDDVSTSNDIVSMNESRINYTGSSRMSYGHVGECKLMIRHNGLVDEEQRGARTRHIEEIFIETARGERFLLPHTNLSGAIAMANHITEGGLINDERADHINQLVEEMNCMRHFVRSAKRRQFEDTETAEMTQAAIHHYDEIKRKLRLMRGARGYRSYFENYIPEAPAELEVDVDALKERFVKKIYDSRFDQALPIVYRAYKKQKKEPHGMPNVAYELEEWADYVAEADWARPDTSNKVRALQEILKTPLLAGMGGVDAKSRIDQIIGDDDLNEAIERLARDQGPDADCTALIKEWLQNKMPAVFREVEQTLQQTGRDSQTNWRHQVSPGAANSHEYADTHGGQGDDSLKMTYEESEDPLDFIRSLAGLKI